MANQLRVTLISTELAYIVFAVSGFCSTTSLPQVRGLMASGLFSFLNLLSIAECANRVQTARGYAVLTIRRRGLSSFSSLSANSSPSMSAALRSFCGMAWAYQLSVRLALL